MNRVDEDSDFPTYATVEKKKATQLPTAEPEFVPVQELYAVPDKTKKKSSAKSATEKSDSGTKRKPVRPSPYHTTIKVGDNFMPKDYKVASKIRKKININTRARLSLVLIFCAVMLTLLFITFFMSVAALAQNSKLESELRMLKTQLAPSCAALPTSSPSGYYLVRASNGSAVSVYCDMTRSCGNVTGGWMRVAELDMMNSSHKCPSGLMERMNPRTCVSINSTYTCSNGTFFDTIITSYTKVCGKIIGYRKGSIDGFNTNRTEEIDSDYVECVTLTYGNPRRHIWTFVAANNVTQCPRVRSPPEFVGSDYLGDNQSSVQNDEDHPLWDCENGTMDCNSPGSPPWFYKLLPQPTTNNIEMRVCRNEGEVQHENVGIAMIALYVQ